MGKRFNIRNHKDGSVSVRMSPGDLRELIAGLYNASAYNGQKQRQVERDRGYSSRRLINTANLYRNMANELYDEKVSRVKEKMDAEREIA